VEKIGREGMHQLVERIVSSEFRAARLINPVEQRVRAFAILVFSLAAAATAKNQSP
jgi:hypothetical protein